MAKGNWGLQDRGILMSLLSPDLTLDPAPLVGVFTIDWPGAAATSAEIGSSILGAWASPAPTALFPSLGRMANPTTHASGEAERW